MLHPVMLGGLLSAALYLLCALALFIIGLRVRKKRGQPNGTATVFFVLSGLMLFLTIAFPVFCWFFVTLTAA